MPERERELREKCGLKSFTLVHGIAVALAVAEVECIQVKSWEQFLTLTLIPMSPRLNERGPYRWLDSLCPLLHPKHTNTE